MMKIPDIYENRASFSREEVARMHGVSVKKVKDLIDEGKLTEKNLGYRTKRITRESVERL